jgi:hypothetical protein
MESEIVPLKLNYDTQYCVDFIPLMTDMDGLFVFEYVIDIRMPFSHMSYFSIFKDISGVANYMKNRIYKNLTLLHIYTIEYRDCVDNTSIDGTIIIKFREGDELVRCVTLTVRKLCRDEIDLLKTEFPPKHNERSLHKTV